MSNSSITIRKKQTKTILLRLDPVHPGEILSEEFLKPLDLSINALTRALRVPPNHVSGIVNEKRGRADGHAVRPLFLHDARVLAWPSAGLCT